MNPKWAKEFGAAITICDADGIILEMNDRAAQNFAASGGRQLIGSNVLDCHPEPARSRLAQILQEPRVNVYITEKQGVHHLVYQAPWFEDGCYAGLVEIIMDVPQNIPHVIRD